MSRQAGWLLGYKDGKKVLGQLLIHMKIGFSKFGFPGFPLNSMFYDINGTHNKSIQIDMIFKYIFCPGLPGKCLHKSAKKTQNVAPQHFVNFRHFRKDIFQEGLDEKNT